jgi:hypothetical protein
LSKRLSARFLHASIPVVVLVSLLVMLLPTPGTGTPASTRAWIELFDGSAGTSDLIMRIAADSSGGVYVAGTTNCDTSNEDWATVKYDRSGNKVWVAIYDRAGFSDSCLDMATDSSGNVFVAGSSHDGSDTTGTVVKYDADGNQLWAKTESCMSGVTHVTTDSSGGVYVTGTAKRLAGATTPFVTAKYDTDGNLVWEACGDAGASVDYGSCWPSDIAVDEAGSVYVTGSAMVIDSDAPNFDIMTVKCDSSGHQLWAARYDSHSSDDDYGYALALDNDSGIYVHGNVPDGCTTIKYDNDGNPLWAVARVGSWARDDIAIDSSGNAYVATYSGVIKYDSDGHQLWMAGGDVNALCLDGSGSVYVTGRLCAAAKYDSDGHQLWIDSEPCTYSPDGEWDGVGIVLGTLGDVFVAARGGENFDSFITMKYEQPNALDTPNNMSPVDGTTSVSLTPTLHSSACSDPDEGDTHAASQWQVTTMPGNYSSTVFDSGVDTSNLTQITLPSWTLSHSAIYYWRVRYQDSHGDWSDWSAETQFTTASAQPIVSPDGWEWQNPLPQGNPLYGVWGSSSSDVFAVGAAGTVLHCDGSTWSGMTSGTTNSLSGVWGSSSSNVFAVGGTILHYDGTAWSPMTSGTTNYLHDVWGSSSSDVFATGNDGTILHCDGTAWSAMTSGTTNNLFGVWGSSSSDVFAVGEKGTILHYDGSAWSAMISGTTLYFNAVWGNSSSDVFAATGSSAILHYDGSTWTTMTGGNGGGLQGLWGISSYDVFAVGDGILHYDGFAWTVMSSDTTKLTLAIWGSSSSDVYAVGGYGTILHYNGSTWSAMSSGTTNDLHGVWDSSSSDVFAVGLGHDDFYENYFGAILHYNGSTWSGMSSGTTNGLYGVWGSSSSNVFAVGGQGTILRYYGFTWSSMTSGTTNDLHGVWGSSSSDVFAVGANGTILHYDGSVWSGMPSGSASDLYAVWGSSSSDVFAVGLDRVYESFFGVILHYDGSTWSAISSGTMAKLDGVWGSSSSDVFAVGEIGTILHYDGSTWSGMTSGPTNDLHGVWGSSSSDVFAVGANGTILHYDGSVWGGMTSGTSNNLNGAWGSSSADVFAVGDLGAILHCGDLVSPAIATDPATSVSTNSAELNGNLASLGTLSSVQVSFEWGLTTDYGNTTPPRIMNEPGSFSFILGDLAPATTYHFRAKGVGDGTVYGEDVTFTTATIPTTTPPAVATTDATGISATSVTLNGDLTSLGSAGSVTMSFVWGTTAGGSYANETPSTVQTSSVTFHYDLSGLTPGTTYYYRAKAVGDRDAVYGLEENFTTSLATVAPPQVTTDDASRITTSSARLNGNLTSLGSASSVTVSFVWGTSPGSYLYETTGQAMTGTGAFYFEFGGLASGTTYYYQAKAAGDGTSYGAEKSFTTGQSPAVEDVDPASGKRHQHLTVTISGANLEGATIVSFGSGITVEGFTVNSSAEITAEIAIDGDATVGNRDVSVTTGWGTATMTDGFSVVGGRGGFCNRASAATPQSRSEMTTTLAALGLVLGTGYWFAKKDTGRGRG